MFHKDVACSQVVVEIETDVGNVRAVQSQDVLLKSSSQNLRWGGGGGVNEVKGRTCRALLQYALTASLPDWLMRLVIACIYRISEQVSR